MRTQLFCFYFCFFDLLRGNASLFLPLLRLFFLHLCRLCWSLRRVLPAFTTDHSATFLVATMACLPLVGVEQGEVVVVGQLLVRLDLPAGEESHPVHPVHRPLLHLTVGFAAVVDEPALAPHPVPVDHHALAHVQAVVVVVLLVVSVHPLLELLVRDHLPKVFHDERVLLDLALRLHTPPFVWGHESSENGGG